MKATPYVHGLALSLRALAIFISLNGISVLLPERWVDSVLVWCGVGPLPDAVLFHYLLRGSGFLLLAFGLLIWVAASDVVRYRPIVVTIAGVFLVGAPVSWWINTTVGLPGWWRILDFSICVLGGGIPLAICLLGSKKLAEKIARPNDE